MPLLYRERSAAKTLSAFVDSYWWIRNDANEIAELIILPDGRIDASFRKDQQTFTLHGLESMPAKGAIDPHAEMFCISFKLPALEWLFKPWLPLQPDTVQQLPLPPLFDEPANFSTLDDFVAAIEPALLQKNMNVHEQKLELFEQLYSSQGAVQVHDLAASVHMTERQINRYFQQLVAMPLKTYASILRFRASFHQLKAGKLYPEQEFSDQSHFIRQIKKFSGVTPKVLAQNRNDRFIQISTLH